MKYNKKITIITISILLASSNLYSMTLYDVKDNNSLSYIAGIHTLKGVSNDEMIRSIQGLNVYNYHEISDEEISVNQYLNIPTNLTELKKGIELFNNYKKKHAGSKVLKEKVEKPLNDNVINYSDDSNYSSYDNEVISLKTTKNNKLLYSLLGLFFFSLVVAVSIILRKRKKKKLAMLKVKTKNNIKNIIKNDKKTLPETMTAQELILESCKLISKNKLIKAQNILAVGIIKYSYSMKLRIKLLEVFGMQKDDTAFNNERDYLIHNNFIEIDDINWKTIDKLYEKYF